MNPFRVLAIGIALGQSVSAFSQISSLNAYANAHYQAETNGPSSQHVTSPFATIPAVAQARSSVFHDGDTGIGRPGRTTCWDDADANAIVTHPGHEQLYARAGGWSGTGGPPETVSASATVVIESWWMASSVFETTVPIDIFYYLDGWLFTSGNSDASFSSVAFSVADYYDASINWLRTTSTLSGESGFSTAFQAWNNWSDSGWNGSWTDTTGTLTSTAGSGDTMWDLQYAETLEDVFSMPTNHAFGIRYAITVTAETAGPYEIFSTSDFFNTAEFKLQCNTPGITLTELNVVPEPSSLIFLGMGALGILSRKRSNGC